VRGTSDPLELDPETMRRLGYRVVDLLVERLATLDEQAAWRVASREELDARFREPAPEQPGDVESLIDRLAAEVIPLMQQTDHPRFLAYIPGTPTWPSVLGDLLAGGANVFNGTWLASAGATEIEIVVLDWFKEWLGYPADAGGVLVGGGSEANLTAVACARINRLGARFADAVVYHSSESHSSIMRALRVLGFAPERVRAVPVDGAWRLRVDVLESMLAEDEARGLRPFLVAANAGATNTGAVDPLAELADVCAAHGLWLHVDGAYGGFAVLSERGRKLLADIDRADSITLDPHKWLFQPWGTGCLLVREPGLLEQAFRIMPDYLQDASIRGAEVNFADRGLQLTRPARALKIWLSVKTFGAGAFREAVDRTIDLGIFAQERIERSGELELLSPATLGIVCFRRCGEGGEEELEELNAAVLARLGESGLAYLSSTRLEGRYSLRMCLSGHRTRRDDVEQVLAWLESAEI
jgi:glutamate/tyrosine decarboxylase-like PLP-dependent enzyme